MKYSEKLRIIEEIARAPVYYPVGFVKNKLLILSNMEDKLTLWILDPSTGEKEQIVKDPVTGVAKPVEETGMIVYSKDVTKGRELSRIYYMYIDEKIEYEAKKFPPQRIVGMAADREKIVFTGSLENKIMLNQITMENGRQEVVYEDQRPFFVSDVEDNVVVGSGHFTEDPRASELFFFDIVEKKLRVYTPSKGSVNEPAELRDKKLLYLTTAFGDKKVIIHDISTGVDREPSYRYDDYRQEHYPDYAGIGWTEEGKIWFVGKKNGRTTAYIDGKKLDLPHGFLSGFVVKKDKAYFGHSSLTVPPKLYMYDSVTRETRLLLDTTITNDILEKLGETKFIKYKSFDGLEIPAFISESRITSKPGPTVVYVHGGPWGEVADSWNKFIAALVATGFHVIAPNFRGSTGYGEEYRLMDIGDLGGADLQDVIYARNYAIDTGIADKTAILGYSYGGFMTYIATTKAPELWDAGVAGAGIVDWEEMYELSDQLFKSFMDILFAGKKELWRDRSPIHYIEKLRAPLCIIHPQNDSRTPLKPILRFMQKLIEHEKTFEAHIVPDMGHYLGKTEDAIKIIYPAIIFLSRYMK